MKRFMMISTLLVLLVASVSTAFAAPAADGHQDIVDIAVEDGRFETLVAAVTAAELADTLKSEGPFTVFAPTDDAFAALPEGTVEALLNDIPALTDILLYHVVPGAVMADQVVTLDAADTVLGEPVTISVMDGKVMVNDAEVIITDIEAANGVIHVIDAVLLPPAGEAAAEEEAPAEAAEMDIVDIAVEDGRFETLVAAVTAADLVDTLKSEGPFTVFAPTDDAFAALPEGTVETLLNDIPALTDILLYHVVAGEVTADQVVTLDAADTALGEPLTISVSDGKVMVNDAEVIITDIEASNGVIHVVDSVLLPAADEAAAPEAAPEVLPQSGGVQSGHETVVDIAVADGRFETLVAAVTAAGLAETLTGKGPFTVFAPTDDAFAALPEGTVEALLNDIPALTDILLYHVVSGEVMAAEVVNLSSADTVLGEPLSISVEDGKVMVNDAEVIITDIEAANGVIHVIDSVLLPPAEAPAEAQMLPETGGETSYSLFLIVLAVGALLIFGGIALRYQTARASNQ